MRKSNKFFSVLMVGLLCLVAFGKVAADTRSDLFFKVLGDEVQRNMSQLVMEKLERPYFISYTIDDIQQLEVSASLGQLLRSQLERSRYLTTDLRVGNYSLDNSNFVSGFSGMGPDFAALPVDDDYDAIRNDVYLATDQAYKAALESLSKKRAYLQSRVIPDRADDHIKFSANKFLDKPEEFDIEAGFFEELAKPMSEVFRTYPAIISSELNVTASVVNQYLVNSEGTQTLRGDRIYGFSLSMAGRSADGEDVVNSDRIIVNDLKQLPAREALIAWTKANAEKMNRMIAADTLEDYIGPALFAGDAAGEFLRQLFSRNVSNLPGPTYENDQMNSMMGGGSDFANKLNRRVLPTTMNVYNDPTLEKIGDTPLIGSYEVDDAGNPPKRTTLVENGKLVNFLIATAPTKKVKESNGSARGAVSKGVTAKPSNLIFESTDKITPEKLKKNLIAMCKDIDLPYGIMITKIRDMGQSSGGFQMFGQQLSGGSSDAGVTDPYEITRIYADGREEPIRGLQFTDVNARILRDIVMTDNSRYVYNYLIGNDYEMPATIVTPSLLIEEMELKKIDSKVKKPPVLPSPLAGQ
ncbi:MAG: metallopeptidase TldD-related protein [Candidatus Zixiibacteriota bacterium]